MNRQELVLTASKAGIKKASTIKSNLLEQMIAEFNNNNKDIRQLGFIAQEVNEIFPKAVSSYNFNNGDLSIPNLLSIDITQINYSLYGAVKKLIEISEDNETRIKKLESLLNIDTKTNNIIY